MINKKIIAVDFDGTLCENNWPYIGKPNIKLIELLKKRQSYGDVILILWTCRVEDKLQYAIEFCAMYGLCFDYINENCKEVVEEFCADARKIFAHEYIDDRSSCMQYDLPYCSCDCDLLVGAPGNKLRKDLGLQPIQNIKQNQGGQ